MGRDYKALKEEMLELHENNRLWLEVAERRQRELQSGSVQEVPADEVLRRARAAILTRPTF
jgi:hypothetical protein